MMQIRLATEEDLDGWMTLIEAVRNVFPGLETPEERSDHAKAVRECIRHSEAICCCAEQRIVGALLFSRRKSGLCFLAVLPEYRRQKIASGMVSKMLSEIPADTTVTVTTYRDGVPEGIAARAFYRSLGFKEDILTEEFGTPVQQFVLRRDQQKIAMMR